MVLQASFSSSPSPAQALFLLVRKRPSMNHEDGIFHVDEVNDLKKPTGAGLSPNQPFLVVHSHGIRSARLVDNKFGLLRFNVVLGNLVAIPLDPPEVMGHAQTSFLQQ
jgi:hypothetical protein